MKIVRLEECHVGGRCCLSQWTISPFFRYAFTVSCLQPGRVGLLVFFAEAYNMCDLTSTVGGGCWMTSGKLATET